MLDVFLRVETNEECSLEKNFPSGSTSQEANNLKLKNFVKSTLLVGSNISFLYAVGYIVSLLR